MYEVKTACGDSVCADCNGPIRFGDLVVDYPTGEAAHATCAAQHEVPC